MGHKAAVLCLDTAGSLLYCGSAENTICVWQRDSLIHTCLSVLTGHAGPVKCLAAAEDPVSSKSGGRRWILYSGSLDKSVKLWSGSEVSHDSNRAAINGYIAAEAESPPSDGSVSSAGRGSQKKTLT